jgi:hypothetical protein
MLAEKFVRNALDQMLQVDCISTHAPLSRKQPCIRTSSVVLPAYSLPDVVKAPSACAASSICCTQCAMHSELAHLLVHMHNCTYMGASQARCITFAPFMVTQACIAATKQGRLTHYKLLQAVTHDQRMTSGYVL